MTNETILECALRETEEETQRIPEVLHQLPTQSYTDSKGDECNVYWYIARDLGQSHKLVEEELTHDLVWTDPDKVEELLTYDNLKQLWRDNRPIVEQYLAELG